MLHDFAELWPERFCNVTNGVTPRRFIGCGQSAARALLTTHIGEGWLRDLERLRGSSRWPTIQLSARAGARSKRAAKATSRPLVAQRTGIAVDPDRCSTSR